MSKNEGLMKMGVVSLLALNACAQAEGVSSTGQAISAGTDLATALRNGSGAQIEDDNGAKYVLIATGLDASGSPSQAVQLYDASGAPVLFAGVHTITGAARVHAVLRQNPQNDQEVVIVGGDNGSGTPIANANRSVILLTLSGGISPNTLSLAESDESAGFVPVYSPSVARCSNVLVTFGGGISSSDDSDKVQYWKPGVGWGQINSALSVKRQGAALAPAGTTNTLFALAGGFQLAAGNQLQGVEAYKFSSTTFTCDTISHANLGNILANERDGSFAFETSFTAAAGATPAQSTILVVAGTDGGTTYSSSDQIKIDWSSPPAQNGVRVNGPALGAAVHHPGFAMVSIGGTLKPVVAGGSNQAGTAQTLAQLFTAGAFSNVSAGPLTAARIAPVVVDAGSDTALALGGDASGASAKVDVMPLP